MVTGTGVMQDDELRDAMYPLPVPETGTVEDAVMAGQRAIRDLAGEAATENTPAAQCNAVSAPDSDAPATLVRPELTRPSGGKKMGVFENARAELPKWNGKTIPADLRDAVQHLAELGPSGPKWGFQQDHEMIERAIDGQTEKLIADVMEFSQSHIRQRFNKLVDRIHARGNSFTREQIRDALQWMLGKTHTA